MHSIYELHCPCVMNDCLTTCMPLRLLLLLLLHWKNRIQPEKEKNFTIQWREREQASLCSRGNGCRRENKRYYKCSLHSTSDATKKLQHAEQQSTYWLHCTVVAAAGADGGGTGECFFLLSFRSLFISCTARVTSGSSF